MKFKVDPTISGQGLRVQDLMVLDILFASKFSRPIYYAITVSDDNKVGLSRYLRMDGLAYKLITVPDQDMSIDRMYENTFKTYKYRNMNDPKVSYDDNIRRLTQNYRTLFLRMVEYYRQKKLMGTAGNMKNKIDLEFPESLTVDQKIIAILDSMQSTITEEAVPMRDYRLKLAIGQFYADAGKPEKLKEYIADVLANEKTYRVDQNAKIRIAALYLFVLKDPKTAVEMLKPIYDSNPTNPEALGYYIQALEENGNLSETAMVLETWLARNPQDGTAKSKLAEIKNKLNSKK